MRNEVGEGVSCIDGRVVIRCRCLVRGIGGTHRYIAVNHWCVGGIECTVDFGRCSFDAAAQIAGSVRIEIDVSTKVGLIDTVGFGESEAYCMASATSAESREPRPC